MDNPVVLVTRVRTNNKGNQALSEGWARALKEGAGESVRMVERGHRFLTRYSLTDFDGLSDPFRRLERIAANLAILAQLPVAPCEGFTCTRLDESISPPKGRLRRAVASLGLGTRAAKFGLFHKSYIARMRLFARSSAVLLNPAGEITATQPDIALRYLLEALVAKEVGARVALVNHTFEFEHPILRQLVLQVYRRLDLIGFRDELSMRRYQERGGDEAIVVPDLAFTTPACGSRSPAKRRRVALAMHSGMPGFASQGEDWVRLARSLSRTADVELVSNEIPTDRAALMAISTATKSALAGEGMDYRSYAKHLAGYRYVVTSRMHTGILAMTAGTPVVLVDPGGLKVRGIADMADLERPVHDPRAEGWTDAVTKECAWIDANEDIAVRQTHAAVQRMRSKVDERLLPAVRDLVS